MRTKVRTGVKMRASKPKIPMWQKQKTGPATSMKRLSTELEIDRNAGIELVHNAKLSELLAQSPLVEKQFKHKQYVAWVRKNIMLNPPFMRVHEARKAAIRQQWSGIWDGDKTKTNNKTLDQCVDEWIEGLWVEWCRWRVPGIRAEIRHKGGYPSSPFAKSIRLHPDREVNRSPSDDESENSMTEDSRPHSPSDETGSSSDDDDHIHVVPSGPAGNVRNRPRRGTGPSSIHVETPHRTTIASRKQPWGIRSGPGVTADQGRGKRRRLEIQVLEAELARADAKLALQKALLEAAVEGGNQE